MLLVLFERKFYGGSPWGRNYDISPDGKRFIMITAEEQQKQTTQIDIVLNWAEELKRLDLPEK